MHVNNDDIKTLSISGPLWRESTDSSHKVPTLWSLDGSFAVETVVEQTSELLVI